MQKQNQYLNLKQVYNKNVNKRVRRMVNVAVSKEKNIIPFRSVGKTS